MRVKTWVRAALLAGALGAMAVMMPFDWCKAENICDSWFAFLCDSCPPIPPG